MGQSFNRHFVQTLPLFLCAPTEFGVQRFRHIANRVLHALMVGNAGILCKQALQLVRAAAAPKGISPRLISPGLKAGASTVAPLGGA
jgi:hypothetical protein